MDTQPQFCTVCGKELGTWEAGDPLQPPAPPHRQDSGAPCLGSGRAMVTGGA